MRRVTTALVTLCLCLPLAHAGKLIETGWDHANPERMRQNLEVMEQTPFQGLVIEFSGPGGQPGYRYVHSGEVWDESAIPAIIEDLRAVQPEQLRDRFLQVNANPGDVDWFDDAGWEQIVHHWRIAARVAKQGGLTGILFDPEPYRDPWRQFAYASQPQADEHSFAEYYARARQRGREVMTVVAEEFPDITLFCYFMLSVTATAAHLDNPIDGLVGDSYGLYPPFIDGWLDVAPETVTFVDGCERAYHFNSQLEYLGAANLIRNTCRRLVSPENRYKYRAQVQVSFGVYLDAYANPPDSRWYIDPGELTPTQRLQANVSTALAVADEYVWVYGEQACWWPTPHRRAGEHRWPELLPGIDAALWAAANPAGYVERLMNQRGDALANLFINGDFSGQAGPPAPGAATAPDWEQGAAPPGWSFWQAGISEGRPGWDREVGHDAPGSGTLTAVGEGCLIQSIEVRPGETYGICAWRRIQGEGSATIRVRWQTPEGRWHAEQLDKMLGTSTPAEEWGRMAGLVTVPDGAGKLIVLLQASGQRSEDDVIWWDDVVVFRAD